MSIRPVVVVLLVGCGGGGAVGDLGTVRAGDSVSFDVPTGTRGFTLLVDGDADFVGLDELTSPSGEAVAREFHGGAGWGVVTFPFASDGAATAPAPAAGRWSARLAGLTGGKGSTTPYSGSLHAVVRFQTEGERGGTLDLDLYVPDGLDTFGRSSDERVEHAFGLFERLYGIGRGDVRVHAVGADVASIVGQPQVDAANRLATYAGPRPSAQVVLTNRLDPDETGGTLSGVSNCLPGAVGVPGTPCSAVIVVLREGAESWLEGGVIVHEVSHFVGLRHTTELWGADDGLSDTPQCADTSKAGLATCPDRNDIMFPSANQSTDEASLWVSPTQRAIVRSASLYY